MIVKTHFVAYTDLVFKNLVTLKFYAITASYKFPFCQYCCLFVHDVWWYCLTKYMYTCIIQYNLGLFIYSYQSGLLIYLVNSNVK